jgi:hypothetical protein
MIRQPEMGRRAWTGGPRHYMRHIVVSLSIGILCLLGQACGPHYVAVRPTYQEPVRPLRPSINHQWRDGNWAWNRQTRSYRINHGNWALPYRNRQYAPGQWKTNSRGHYWVTGRWR